MKRFILFSTMILAAVTSSFVLAAAPAPTPSIPPHVQAPQYPERIATMPIEVCFVLDTTGSMSGLIEGAKQKIWSISNNIIKDNPKSTLKIALVPYRDRGDAYITRVIDLTDDLDGMYKELMAFQAAGGGDEPESVNQALQDAVEKVSWGGREGKQDSIRLIFLVGDCPPHMDYQDDVKYPVTLEKAVKKNIIVDTVQCGANASTTPIWTDIARLGEGQYLSTAQEGAMVAIKAPQDARLTELGAELAKTVVPYGSSRQQSEVREKNALNIVAASAPTGVAAAAADRVAFNAGGGGRGQAIGGMGDLTKDIQSDGKLLDSLKADELPEPMKSMTPAEQKAYIDKQIAQRNAINDEIAKVSKERDEYIKAETAKNAKPDSFDVQVVNTIHSNAAAARAAAAARNK